MKESVTYQAIVEEGVIKGRLEEARRILLRQGEQRFGSPAATRIRAQVEAVNSLDLLEQLADRVLQASTWEDLVAGIPVPASRRKGRQRRE